MSDLKNKGDSHSQWNKYNIYCPECHVTSRPHLKGCKGKKIRITSSARIPRKNASKKVWEKFYRKFVLQEDLKAKLEEIRKSEQSIRSQVIRRSSAKGNTLV